MLLLDPQQLKSVTDERAVVLGLPIGILDLVRPQVSPWKAYWNSKQEQGKARVSHNPQRAQHVSNLPLYDPQPVNPTFEPNSEEESAWKDLFTPGMDDEEDFMIQE